MKPSEFPSAVATNKPMDAALDISIPRLVGEIYESAPLAERGHLLEPLLRPLGVLSLLAVANGIFASVRFRSGWPDLHVQLDDIRNVRATDVIALMDYVQQVSFEAVDGLAQMLTSSPGMASSAAVALLLTMLVRRAQARRSDADNAGDASSAPN